MARQWVHRTGVVAEDASRSSSWDRVGYGNSTGNSIEHAKHGQEPGRAQALAAKHTETETTRVCLVGLCT